MEAGSAPSSLDRGGEEEVGLIPSGSSKRATCEDPDRAAGIYSPMVCCLEMHPSVT